MRSLILIFMVLAGCHTTKYTLTKSTTAETTARPADCTFRVVNLPPQGDYEEIATLTPASAFDWANDPVQFQNVVRKDVCSIGGDVVVTEVNGNGGYVRGTVLRAVRPRS